MPNLLPQYVELDHKRRDLEDRLKVVKGEMYVMEPKVREWMVDQGMQNTKTDCGLSVYIERTLPAAPALEDVDGLSEADKKKARQQAKERLTGILAAYPGTADIVRPWYDSRTLTAWVKELMQDEETTNDDGMPILPPELKDHIHVHELFRVKTRRV